MGVNTMRYKIIGRVIKGRETVGYRLIGEDKKERIVSKEDLIKAVKQGLVVNAVYNKATGGIGGIKGVDLRSLPVIRHIDVMNSKKDKAIKEKVKTNSKNNSKNNKMESLKDKKVIARSNHQLAKEYQMKAELLGNDRLKFRLLDGDRVELYRVNGGEDTGRLVISKFITSVEPSSLAGCKYSEIYIDNQEGIEFNASELCSDMKSKKLKVIFKNPSKVVNMDSLFSGCELLSELDISNLDLRNVKSMGRMFSGCKSLKELDLNKWDVSKVWDMEGMFKGCELLGRLNISKWDVSKVENMSEMFSGCKSLKELDLNKWDVSKVWDMEGMFKGCELLGRLNISKWDVSKVENMSEMFSGCKSLKELDLNKWDVSKVWDISDIIKGCKSLDLKYSCKQGENSNHELAKKYIREMELKGLDTELKFRLSIFDRVELYSVENKVSTGRLIIPSFITDIKTGKYNLMNYEYNDYILSGCKYSEIYIENSDNKVFNASGLCGYMESKKLKVVFKNPKKVVNINKMFYNCKASEIDLSGLDTSNIIDMTSTFHGCINLNKIDVSRWDVSKVKYMSSIFDSCKSLKELDISRWNVSNVVNTEYMFNKCESLVKLDVSKWDVSEVASMINMFDSCKSLKELDISKWDIGNVIYMFDIFNGCDSLKEVYIKKSDLDIIKKVLDGRLGIIKYID